MNTLKRNRSVRKVKQVSKSNKRFDLYTLSLDANCKETGAVPTTEEWHYELPQQNQNEEILIYGVNSNGDALIVRFKRLLQTGDKYLLKAYLCYKCENDIYSCELFDLVSEQQTESYKLKGLNIQVLSPFRLWRITFRGVLHKKSINENEEKVFVKLNILWIPLSKIFDFKSDHNASFIGQQLQTNGIKDELFEDRYEQYGELKGTIQIEANSASKIFLWGNKCKNILDDENLLNASIKRFYGYSKEGLGFHIGCLTDSNDKHRYQYGHCYATRQLALPIVECSLSLDDLNNDDFNASECKLVTKGPRILEIKFGEQTPLPGNLTLIRVNINESDGACVTYKDNLESDKTNEHKVPFKVYVDQNLGAIDDLLVDICGEKFGDDICGGKGSSLTQLSVISKELKNNEEIPPFIVPNGIIVTTNSYKMFLNENQNVLKAIENLEMNVWQKNYENLKSECEGVIALILETKLSNLIKKEIEFHLKRIFRDNVEQRKFAVRSSASGEDSEEMSAAGQMTSYLGVKGFDNIYKSVVQCWSSQFTHIAVEYKHGYGQLINTPMAVVIQEMVDCELSGVMFTCNPVNGDPRRVLITANYGLCESVVSAAAEPDTITVLVDPDTEEVKNVESTEIGSKKMAIKLSDSSNDGTIEVELDSEEAKKCCVENDQAISLTKVALFLRRCFGNERDIEWGIKEGKIYLLQSRPVTNLEGFTEFELMHEMDSATPKENQTLSRANLGEVAPGSVSPLGLSFTNAGSNVFSTYRHTRYGLPVEQYCPYFLTDVAFVYNKYFFDLDSMMFDTSDKNSAKNQSTFLAIFGHEIEDPEFVKLKDFRVNPIPKSGALMKIKVGFMSETLPSGFRVRRSTRRFGKIHLLNEKSKFKCASDLYDHIINSMEFYYEAGVRHGECTMASISGTASLVSLLTKNDPKNPYFVHDFSILLSENKDVTSLEIPQQMRIIAESIKDGDGFGKMSDEEALNYLKNGESEASNLFNKFLRDHGHRGYKELDIYYQQWEDKPIPIIKSIKSIISAKGQMTEKTLLKKDDRIAQLKTPLTASQKFMLKNFLLPWSQKTVGYREQAKSLLMYIVNQYRKMWWKLAEMMVNEGRLPEKELLFFLKLDEVDRLVKKRDATLVMRAKQRMKIFPKMDVYQFEEILKGPDYEPNNIEKVEFDASQCDKVKGTTVCLGKVTGRAVVAHSFDDVKYINSGDILITYSTDVGWTPYFPMLSGIVTEIGGLISHGAVVAREFGLPCLIGATNATQMFQTGDTVVLDCENATLFKVKT